MKEFHVFIHFFFIPISLQINFSAHFAQLWKMSLFKAWCECVIDMNWWGLLSLCLY